MSKDATVEIISEVKAHPNADRLDLVTILGFQCVTQKGLYTTGTKVVYVRPDAVLPIEPWAEEYRKYSPKRIKAVKLRNEWSEGIIVPIDLIKDKLPDNLEIGQDVAEFLSIVHYEPPTPQELNAKGYIPYGIVKTDEERWENMIDNLPMGEKVDVTLKVDGQSWSAYYKLDEDSFGILGRTMEYKTDAVNNYTYHLAKYDIKNKLKDYCQKHGVSLCIRGESYGEGIQNFENNPHAKQSKGLAIFSVFLIDEHEYAHKGHQFYYVNVARDLGLPTVDMLEEDVILTQELIDKYSKDISKINGKSFEGVVIKHQNGSFKIINKDYDSKK